MAKILLINPNKYGRGITTIWIASHSAVLKGQGHEVQLFDCTFYSGWTDDEIGYNTRNEQYKPSRYPNYVTFKTTPIVDDLQKKINEFRPDYIFWSAVSSHIHAEGEYVNIEYGYSLIDRISTSAIKITAGLQVTANPEEIIARFPKADFFIRGESELVLPALIMALEREEKPVDVAGIVYKNVEGKIVSTSRQPILSDMDAIPPYDYSIFEDQVFWRSYNGRVVRAVDYEISRGCIYACGYCVETVLQHYYGFDDIVEGKGTIRRPRDYLRQKSASRVFAEWSTLHREKGVQLIRCQDTNFLTIKKTTLDPLSDLVDRSDLDIRLYIETRPEGINESSIALLKKLKVDGVGMGIELSTQEFREEKLHRYADQEKIIRAFELLRAAGIRRTAYNIIGFPEQDEASILETIRFNQRLDPDNITIAFFSPYLGTEQQRKADRLGIFNPYEYSVDAQLRSLSKDTTIDIKLLEFYKKQFNQLVRNGLSNLKSLKAEEDLL